MFGTLGAKKKAPTVDGGAKTQLDVPAGLGAAAAETSEKEDNRRDKRQRADDLAGEDSELSQKAEGEKPPAKKKRGRKPKSAKREPLGDAALTREHSALRLYGDWARAVVAQAVYGETPVVLESDAERVRNIFEGAAAFVQLHEELRDDLLNALRETVAARPLLVQLVNVLATYPELHKKEPRKPIAGPTNVPRRDIWSAREAIPRPGGGVPRPPGLLQTDCMLLYPNNATSAKPHSCGILINKEAGGMLVLVHQLVYFTEIARASIQRAVMADLPPAPPEQADSVADRAREDAFREELRQLSWQALWERLVGRHAEQPTFSWSKGRGDTALAAAIIAARDRLYSAITMGVNLRAINARNQKEKEQVQPT